jgi:hypothetical protein
VPRPSVVVPCIPNSAFGVFGVFCGDYPASANGFGDGHHRAILYGHPARPIYSTSSCVRLDFRLLFALQPQPCGSAPHRVTHAYGTSTLCFPAPPARSYSVSAKDEHSGYIVLNLYGHRRASHDCSRCDSRKRRKNQGFGPLRAPDEVDAGLMIFIALLWPIWLLAMLAKKDPKK